MRAAVLPLTRSCAFNHHQFSGILIKFSVILPLGAVIQNSCVYPRHILDALLEEIKHSEVLLANWQRSVPNALVEMIAISKALQAPWRGGWCRGHQPCWAQN